MKMMKKAINIGLALSFVVSGAFAQSLKDAKSAINQEQYEKAKVILKNLVQTDAKEGDNYFYLGEVYLISDYVDSAKMVFTQGNTADPKNPINKVGLGTVELLNGNAAGAQTLFDEATAKLKRKEYEPLLAAGKAYLKGTKPDYNKALEYLLKAKATGQEDAEIDLAIGNAYFGMGSNSEAYTAYRDASSLDNTLLNAKIQLAVISKEAFAFPEASADLEAIVAENPNFAPTYRELAETYYLWSRRVTTVEEYNAKLQEALSYYKKYMDLTDYSLDSRMRYADFLILAKDYETLEVQANEMAKLDQANPRILRYLGYSAYENGNYQESKQAITDFMSKVEPERLIARDFMFLGMADLRLAVDPETKALDMAAVDAAVGNLTKAVQQDSSIAEDLSEVGMQFFQDQQYGAAAKVFEVSIQNPESKNYFYDHYYLGLAHYFDYALKMNDEVKPDKAVLQKGVSAFSKLIELAPETDAAYLYRAKTYRLIDDAETPEGDR